MDVTAYIAKDRSWVWQQINTPIQTFADIAHAYVALRDCDLPRHLDMPKNWDNYLAVAAALELARPMDPVLDAGGCRDSAFLPGLERLGFPRLNSVNLDEEDGHVGTIQYRRGDIEKLRFPNFTFGFIACLSVIEHGVDWRKFFSEAHRVLRPDGHLFVSTDYWETPVPTGGQTAFGAPVRVFTESDIRDMSEHARKVGLHPVRGFVTGCQDRVIEWLGMEYTFINLLFRRQ